MKIIFSLLCCLSVVLGYAQNHFDIAKLSYTNTPKNEFDDFDSSTTVEELALALKFPVVINEKTTLLTGLFTNKTKVKLDSDASHSNLKILGVNLGVNKVFNDKWSGTFYVIPKIASDHISFSKENLQIAFLTLITKQKRENLKYRYGFYINTEKYGPLMIPLFGIYYLSPNKRFETNLYLPSTGDINYRLKDKIWLGMTFDGLGTTYNLTEQDYTADGAYVSKVSNEAFAYLRFQLSKSLYLNTKAGYAVRRNYGVYGSNDKIKMALGPFYFDDNRTELNNSFKDGALFKLELMYRIHFDKK
ncbi:DUF6268 family outer membrane beta-barrel protein [Tamlana sp. 2_MG-2023]|uniref:DUF6268 family outer membrane beta-barrel protein n=1 Tax=unclassified Tamlana TaxID=2614803 RepID=UPI0026E44523|nr:MULTISPECIES: DUF6268 family outer membrane beta-barrel protein [unclassified Tamlana]MDO6759496.1 DUF6268 family outer membrane beta-barrel protein [Tamlana sp. 2_MG-2023]MDO6790365.1 DUF6268 family outer membrane beta-barrel protein [Tamlana sp. 1_MG-2023]